MGAMIQETQSPLVLLRFLRETYYPGLPSAVWTQHLWFYKSLLPLMNQAITGGKHEGLSLFTAREGGSTQGAGIVLPRKDGPTAVIAADTGATALSILDAVARVRTDVAFAEIGSRDAGQLSNSQLLGDNVGGTSYYWTNAPAPELPATQGVVVRELRDADVRLYDEITFPNGSRGWPELRQCLAEGLRYFGALMDGHIISTAGVCKTTAFSAEIIAVGTINEADRRKGYATLCAARALSEGLSGSEGCTWTCRRSNVASRRVAEKLGMQLMSQHSRYRIRRVAEQN